MSRYRTKTFPKAVQDHGFPIEAAVREFLLRHERKGDSLSYIRELRSYLVGGSGKYGKQRPWKPLVVWSKAECLTNTVDLSKERLGAFLDNVRSVATLGDYGKVCAILKRFLDYCVSEGHLEALPIRIERPKRLKAEIKVFTPEEMARLRDVVSKENVRDWAIFMLLNDTGIRASELCNLRVDDFRWEREELLIRPQIAKNKSFRIIPLCASLRALQRYREIRGDDTAHCDKFFLAFYSTPVVKSPRGKRRNTGKLVFCSSGIPPFQYLMRPFDRNQLVRA